MSGKSPLPHSQEAERAVLAGVLLRPECLDDLELSESEFYIDRHRSIYSCYRHLASRRLPIDLRTVQARLEETGELERVGGLTYLSGLDLDLPDLGRLAVYADIVRERARRRRLTELGRSLSRGALRADDGLDELLRSTRRRLEELDDGAGLSGSRDGESLTETVLAQAQERRRLRREEGITVFGLPTGIPRLDQRLSGLNQGLHILAGSPGMGKTSFALQLALHVARSHPVLYVTFENSGESLILKAICGRAGVGSFDAMRGTADPATLQRAAGELAPQLRRLEVIEGSPRLTVSTLRSAALRAMERGSCRRCLVVVDYIQLMAKTVSELRSISDVRGKVDTLTGELIALGKRLGSPILVLSSQSRSGGGYGSGGGGRDALDSLKESGDLEFGGDVVMFLTEDKERAASPPARAVNLSIKKHRHGPTDRIPLLFMADRGLFREEMGRTVPSFD